MLIITSQLECMRFLVFIIAMLSWWCLQWPPLWAYWLSSEVTETLHVSANTCFRSELCITLYQHTFIYNSMCYARSLEPMCLLYKIRNTCTRECVKKKKTKNCRLWDGWRGVAGYRVCVPQRIVYIFVFLNWKYI